MKEEIYGWMKNLAVYYIFLEAVMNFVPDEKYARYIRYFMGLLLILLLCSPILQIFTLDSSLMENLYRQMWASREEMLESGSQEQQRYLTKAYEREVESQIKKDLEELSFPIITVEVRLAGEPLEIRAVVLELSQTPVANQEEEIVHELEEKYRIGRERISFFYSGHGEAAVDSSDSGGSPSGSDRDANQEP